MVEAKIRKLMSAHLSKELIQQFKRRSFPVKRGDEVQVMRGEHAGKTGKVSRVDYGKQRVYLEGITRKRTVGTEVQVPIHPNKLKIIGLSLEDKLRKEKLGVVESGKS